MKHTFFIFILIASFSGFVNAQSYTLEYISGNNQTFSGGMPAPMVFKIKDNTTKTYITNLAAAGLTMEATSTEPTGVYDGKFNNLNDYCKNGDAACFGGYYYVPTNKSQSPFKLTISVLLKKGTAIVAEYKSTQNIGGPTAAAKYNVISATWAVGAKKADVTKRVQQLSEDGQPSFEARNHILNADPAQGQRKTLTVVYTINGGAPITKSCGEREFFTW